MTSIMFLRMSADHSSEHESKLGELRKLHNFSNLQVFTVFSK